MSFDRFLAVTKAFDSRKWLASLRSPTASYVISAIGWIFSALLCVQLYRYSRITECSTCEYIFPTDVQLDSSGFSQNELNNIQEEVSNSSSPVMLSPGDKIVAQYFYENNLDETGTTFNEFINCIHNSNNSAFEDCLGNGTSPTESTESPGPTCRLEQPLYFRYWYLLFNNNQDCNKAK